MSIIYKINGVTLSLRVRLLDEGEGFTEAAERGVVGMGGVLIDDPNGDLTITGWQTFTVDDDEAFPDNRIFTGYIAERPTGRQGRYRVGVSRVHSCTLLDLNALLHIHVLRANAAKRPIETDVARVNWLLSSEALAGIVFDQGLVSASNPGTFLAADIRRRFADDVMAELAPSAVKNFFVYRDFATGTHALFYDRDDAAVNSSALRLSNVATDVDGVTTFAPSIDAEDEIQPHDVYSGVSYGWQGTPIYVTSSTTRAAYFGVLGGRDAVYDTDRIGRLATAQTAAQAWLNVRSTETHFITVSVILPSGKASQIKAGQRLQVKFSHLDGFTSFTWTRVRRCSAKPFSPTSWELRLELWVPAVPVADATTSTGSCPAIVQQVTEPYTGAGNPSLTFPAPVTAGNHLIAVIARRGPFSASIDDPTLPATSTIRALTAFGATVDTPNSTISALAIFWRLLTGDEQTLEYNSDSQLHVTHYEVSGLDADPSVLATVVRANEQAAGSTFSLGTIGSAGSVNFLAYLFNRDFEDTDYYTMGAGWTVDSSDSSDSGRPYVEVGHSSGSIAATATAPISVEWAGFAVALTGTGCGEEDSLPFTGNPVGPTTPSGTINGSNPLFNNSNSTYPGGWLPDTLRVLHDGLDQTAHVTTSDDTTGAFTLDYAPSFGSTLRVTYQSN